MSLGLGGYGADKDGHCLEAVAVLVDVMSYCVLPHVARASEALPRPDRSIQRPSSVSLVADVGPGGYDSDVPRTTKTAHRSSVASRVTRTAVAI